MQSNIYKRNTDGTVELIEVIETEVDEPTQEEVIAEKEAQLLAMYEEIQALKQN
jgi:hypothetical protein